MGRNADPDRNGHRDRCRRSGSDRRSGNAARTRRPRNGRVGSSLIGNYNGEKKSVEQVPVEEVSELTKTEKYLQFVDVRRNGEYNAGHAVRASIFPLDKLGADFDKLDPEAPTYVICQGGYRSSIGTSILENAGFNELYNVTGGTAAWIAAGLADRGFRCVFSYQLIRI